MEWLHALSVCFLWLSDAAVLRGGVLPWVTQLGPWTASPGLRPSQIGSGWSRVQGTGSGYGPLYQHLRLPSLPVNPSGEPFRQFLAVACNLLAASELQSISSSFECGTHISCTSIIASGLSPAPLLPPAPLCVVARGVLYFTSFYPP